MDKIKMTKEQNDLILNYIADNYNRARWCVTSVIKHNPNSQEWDDYLGIVHEALIKAARTYKLNKNMTFISYADMNIKCQIKTKITRDNRKKRKAVNGEVSLSDSLKSEEGLTYEDLCGAYDVGYDETTDVVQNVLKKMNKFEREVTKLLMYDYTTKEICKKLRCHPNKINAVKEFTYKRIDILSELR